MCEAFQVESTLENLSLAWKYCECCLKGNAGINVLNETFTEIMVLKSPLYPIKLKSC